MPRSTGDAKLDAMLGGGIPDGRTVLVRGPSGVGKSRLAMQFLETGLADDEECLYVSTDEPLDVLATSLDPPDSDDMTVASIHRDDSGGGVRFVSAGDRTTIPFDSLIERLSMPDWDRIAVDGAPGLVDLAPDHERGRHGLFHLLERLSDHDGTALMTALDDQQTDLDRVATGVIDCWHEEIEGDTRQFLQIRKLRGVDHDTRRHTLSHDDDGVSVAAREWTTSERPFRTGISSFDDLAGGFVRGGTTVFGHEGTADHWPVTAALCARAVEQDVPIVLTTAPGTLVNRVNGLLSDQVGDVRSLMERDLLYLIDPISRDEDALVLQDLPMDNVLIEDIEGSIQEAIRALVTELVGRTDDVLSIFEHTAIQHLVDENQARQLFYWASGNLMTMDTDLSLVLTVDRTVTGNRLTGFFEGVADQVVRTWRGSDELQYLSIPKSPTGTPGHTRVVEPLEDSPYVRLR
jgi:circadian clock protein KaiC